MSLKNRFAFFVKLFIILSPLLIIPHISCSPSGHIGHDQETDYIIDSMWADYPTIVAGRQTDVYARVIGANSRKPLRDIIVQFSTDIGRMENTQVLTNANGIATVTFISTPDSVPQTATITGKVVAEQIRTRRLTINILPTNFTNPYYVFLTSEPETVYADGASMVEMTALVMGQLYVPLANHQVSFQFVSGNNGDIILTVDNFAITGVDGRTRARFRAPTTARTIIMSATVYGIDTTVTAYDTIWVLPIPNVDFIDLRANPTSIPADGASELELSAYVTIGSLGIPAPNGTVITFYSEDGTLLHPTSATGAVSKKSRVASPQMETEKRSEKTLDAIFEKSKRAQARRPSATIIATTTNGYARVKLRSSTTAHRVMCTASATLIGGGTVEDTVYVNFTAGSAMSIVVTSARSTILADGHDTTRITATVYDRYGNRLGAGNVVSFATDKGSVFPLSSLTDTSGRATTVLISGVVPGYARVSATCGSAFGFTEVLFTTTIPKYIQLTAQPNQLRADGVSQSLITAEVLDSTYAPVTDGVRINFYSSLGLLSAGREKPLLARGKSEHLNMTMDTRVATTSGGFARVTLTSGFLADTCIVAAWFAYFDTITGETVITATDTIKIPFLPGEPSRIVVSFSRDSIQADQEDTATVWADVYDAHDNLVRAGYPVTFTPDATGGTVSPTISNTNQNGRAQTKLTSSRSVGWHTVTASATGATPGAGNIYFYPVKPAQIRLLMEIDSAIANGADTVTISAYVTDDRFRPCSDGSIVYFTTTDLGTFLPSASRARFSKSDGEVFGKSTEKTAPRFPNPRGRVSPEALSPERMPERSLAPLAPMTADSFEVPTGAPFPPGIARVNLIAPTTIGSTWVFARVATSDTTYAVDSMFIVFVPGAPARIYLTAEPDTMPADSASESNITAYVTDAHGNPVGPMFFVEFSMAPGSELYGWPVVSVDPTDDSSRARTRFRCYYRTGEAVMTARLSDYPHVSGNVSIWLTGASAGEVILTTDSTRIHIGKSMGLRANVYDSVGNPITDGTHVNLRVQPPSMGRIIPSNPVTSGGLATATFRPDTITGSCLIIASVGAIADTKSVQILPGDIARIVLRVVPDTLPADGISSATAIARCYDVFGNPAEMGSYVRFSTDLGSIETLATIDTSGIASAIYTAGTTVGIARVRAWTGTAPIATANVYLVGSSPYMLILTADSTHIAIGGSSLRLTAYCVDILGRPVSDRTRIDFSSRIGSFSSPFAFTSAGFCNTNLISGTIAGFDTVIASTDTGRVADTLVIRFDAGQAVFCSLSANPNRINADPRARSRITGVFYDAYYNRIGAGRQVSFTSEYGYIISSVTTDNNGVAITEYRASNDVDSVRIHATLDFAHCWTYVMQDTFPAAFISVSANPNIVPANGRDSCVVTAHVLNDRALPVPDGTIVNFRNVNTADGTTVGDLVTFAGTVGGYARVPWRSPTYTANAIVWGNVYGLEDSALVRFVAGSPAGITIDSITPSDSIPADGESRGKIFATVRDDYGNPVPGAEVVFSASPIGTFIYNRGNTNREGWISVQIYSSVAGRTTVMATSAGYTDYAEIVFTPLVAANIYVTADPVEIIADGISTSTVRAFAVDSASAAVPNNTPIRFTTDRGFVFPGVGYTTDGMASTTLRSSTTVGTATITANAGFGVSANTTVRFIPGPPARIDLLALPDNIPANGDTFALIRAVVYDRNNNLVGAGVKVRFTTTLGTIDTANYTNALGELTVRLYAGVTPGTAVVWASSGSALSQVTVNFMNTEASFMYLYLDPNEVVADGRSTAMLTGRVTNDIGLPVSDGSPVMLRVTTDSIGAFGFMAPITAHTDSGNFSAIFTANTRIGRAYIIARANPTVTESVMVDLIPGAPDSIWINATPNMIPADSFSTSVCSVRVFDRFANPVGAGIPLNFTATLGRIAPSSDVTNSSGRATTYFTAGRRPGEARIRAISGTAHSETYILLTNSDVAYITVTIDSSRLVADGISRTFVRAHVTDSLGNPVTDMTPVRFSIDTVAGSPGDTAMAFITPIIGFTYAGDAVVSLRSGTNVGRIWIKACTDTLRCGNAFLDLVPGPVDSIAAWADDAALPANGESFTFIHARLYDRYGNSVGAGVPVNFSTTAGTINPAVAYTNSAGEAMTVLTSGTVPAIARVNVSSGTRHAVVTVSFDITPPAFISLRAEPRRINADGESFSTITANVLNELGQPINNGTMVVFHSIDDSGLAFGSIDTMATTTGGIASVRLYSGTTIGRARVSARVGTLSDTTFVWFTPGPPHRVEMSATPSVLFANGSDTATVTTSVYDRFNNLVQSGERIDFSVGPSASLGYLFPSWTYTNDNAPSNITFQAGVDVGTAIVTGVTTTGPAGFTMIRLIPLTVGSIDVFADSLSLVANGVSTTTVRALVLDTSLVAVSDSTPIRFTTSAGVIYPGVAYTRGGEAIATLRAGSTVDTAMVIAYVGTPGAPGYVADTVYVRFRAGAPYAMEIYPDSVAMTANGESRCFVRARVFDSQGNPVAPGHIIRFTTTLGTIDTIAITEDRRDTLGVAITVLRTGIIPGTALIMATYGSVLAVGRVDFIPSDLGEMFVTVTPNRIVADGVSTAIVSGMVRNSVGNPVSNGTPVRIFDLPDPLGRNLGDITPVTAYTDSGKFNSTFMAWTVSGRCQIVAYVGDTARTYISDTTSIELIPGTPDSIYVVAIPDTLPADSFSTSIIRAYVFDRFGNRVSGGHTVNFATTRGSISPLSDETNSAGMAETYLRSSFQSGVARVVARSGVARGETNVVFWPTIVTTVSLSIEDRVMQADGYSETTCRATVLDSLGNPVSNGTPVLFTMWPDTLYDTLLSSSDTLGMLIPTIAFTNSGVATTRFRVSTRRGRVWIRASVSSASDQAFIQILPGALSYIDIDAEPDSISANGRDISDITATLYDDFGNRLLSGESVSFGTDLGSIGPTSTFTNSAGDAYSILTAGTTPGRARVWARSGSTFELTEVIIRRSTLASLLLTADPVQLVADGMSQSVITCQAFDSDGSPVSDGTVINFRVNPIDTAGMVVSPKLTLGGACVTIFTASTTVGRGSAWIVGEAVVGSITIRDSVRIFLRPGPATTISVWADSSHVPRDTILANGSDNIFIFARVLDQYGNRLRAGENVTFTTNRGTIEPSSITDTSGVARSLLTAGITPGYAIILVRCGSALGFAQVFMDSVQVTNVILVPDTNILIANGLSRTKLRAYVYSAGGHIASNGIQVRFEVPSGLAHPEPNVAYTDSGVAITNLRADTVATSSIVIWAIAGNDTGRAVIRLNPGPASRIVAYSADDTIYADGFSNTAIACTVFDRYSNPIIPGTPVSFTTTLGTIIPAGYTNMSGYAFSRLTAGTLWGDALITIRCGDAIEFLSVFLDSLRASEIIVNVIPRILPGDGTSTANITAYVYDVGGLPVSDNTRVTFAQDTTAGRVIGIITPRVAFTSGGRATATLTAPINVGTGYIIARVGATVADTAMVTYIPGSPATIEFDMSFGDSLPADGGAYPVVVRVYDMYHNPVNIGTEVTFTSSRGTIMSPSVVDNALGEARTLVSSTSTGPAFITARSGSAVASRPYYFYPLTADIIDLVANPIRITADGRSTSNLLATVLDTTGGIRPVSDNTPVFFTSRGGGIVSPRTAYTVDGQVTATLYAGIRTGRDTVVATVGVGVSDTVYVDFVPGPPAIVDFMDPFRNMVADGADTQTIWVRVTDSYGNSVPPGLPVTYSISLGYITPAGATNDSGYSSAVVVSGTRFGTASVSATCSGISGYSTITFVPLVAESLLLVANPPTLVANGASYSDLTAVVFDSFGLPVSDGILVRFSTTNGIVSPAVAYTAGGIATSRLTSGTSPSDSVYVVARAGGSAIDTAIVRFIPGPPAVMRIWASDSSIVANGADTTRIFVEVLDAFGNSVGAGVAVNFTASLGTITPIAYTDINGRCNVRLISGSVSGFSNVTATAGASNASILIEFYSTMVGSIDLTVVPSILIANGSSTAEVTAYVLDTLGNPVSDGTTVRFSGLSFGSVTPMFATTTSGIARATIRSYTTVGWDTLIARSGDSTAIAPILFESGPPAYVWLWPRETTLLANESDTTRIFGRVTDASGNPVRAGRIVTFTVDPPSFGTIWSADVTDDSGYVDVPFRSAHSAGVAIIRGTCEGITGITQVVLIPTNVADIQLTVIERYLPADGVSSASVTAYVTDSTGLQIADGTGVRFAQDRVISTTLGILTPTWRTTTGGSATVSLYAPTIAGTSYVYSYIPRPTIGDTVFSDTVSVFFRPGNVAVVRFARSFAQLYADGLDTLGDSLWVEDAFGNRIAGATVVLSLGLGSVTPPIGVTNASGGLYFKLTAPTRIGSSYITASCGTVSGYLPVQYLPTLVDTILLSISPRGLPADGAATANVRVTVLDARGNPVSDGVVVRFTARRGLITPMDSLRLGIAQAILVAADSSGVDTIMAICQNDTARMTVTYSAGAPRYITLNVVPDTATVGSTRTSVVSGRVADAANNPVARGTFVYLTMDTTGMGSVADPVVSTNDTGYFFTNYSPGLRAGLTGLTASVGSISARRSILLKAGPPYTMQLSVSRNFIYVRGVGEIDQSVISAVIYDQYDNPVRDSTPVVFRIVEYPTGGSILPELIPGGGLISSTVYTMAGRASVALRSGDRSGSIVVEANAGAGALISRAPRVTVGSGLPRTVSVSRTMCNVRGWDIDGVPNGIKAIITDQFNNPVAPGTAVWFTARSGAITTSATVNDSGFAFATWYSANPRQPGGIVWVIAETRDTSGVRRDSVSFYSSGPADSMAITVMPGFVWADSTGFSDVQVSVWDVNGNPVTDSTRITVITDWGTIVSPIYTSNQCYHSFAITRYKGRNLYQDNYCGSDTAGFAYVTANIGGLGASGVIYLKHGQPNSTKSSISAPTDVPYNTSFIVSAKIVDQFGNPICGESVTMTGANVIITSPATRTTGITGEANWTCQAPDSSYPALGILMVTINSTGGTFSARVNYVGRRRPAPISQVIESDMPPEKMAIVRKRDE